MCSLSTFYVQSYKVLNSDFFFWVLLSLPLPRTLCCLNSPLFNLPCLLFVVTRLWPWSFRTYSFTYYQSVKVEILCCRQTDKPNHGEEQKKKGMDRGMVSSHPTEKLDRSNYASWSYKMHRYLLGHGYWSYVDGANDATPESTHRDFPAWEHAASRVLYCFTSCVGD